MKWYKHGAQSLNDAVISEAIAEFGGDGYLAFFGTLELMADEFDIFNPGIMSFSWRFLRKNLQLSRQKLTEIYSYFDEKAKENQSKDKGFLVLFADDGVTINCKKLAKLCDTHTQKLLRDRSKQLQSDIEVTSQKLTQEVRSKKEEVRNKNKKKNKEYVEGEIPFDLAIKFYNEILKNKPDYKKPNMQLWAKDFDLMIRIDKREPRKIEKVFKWCQSDDFEKTNVLSPGKLRQRFDQLEMKAKKQPKQYGLVEGDLPYGLIDD
jgi:hypothetical protein